MLGATSEQVHACPAYGQEISQHTTQKQGSQHNGADAEMPASRDLPATSVKPEATTSTVRTTIVAGDRTLEANAVQRLRNILPVQAQLVEAPQTRNPAFNATSGGELARQTERTLQAVLRVAKAVQAVQQASAVRSDSARVRESCAQRLMRVQATEPATQRKQWHVCLSCVCPLLPDVDRHSVPYSCADFLNSSLRKQVVCHAECCCQHARFECRG